MTDEPESSLRLKVDPLAHPRSIVGLSWILLASACSLYVSTAVPLVRPWVEMPVWVVAAGLVVIPVVILLGHGTWVRLRSKALDALASHEADPALVEALRRLHRQTTRDALVMGVGGRVQLRFDLRGQSMVTVVSADGHVIVVGLGWARALHEREPERFGATARAMLLHELGHVLGRDVFVLGMTNLCLALVGLGLFAGLTPLGGAAPSLGSIAQQAVLLALLTLPHAYVARRRESFADAISLRFQNHLAPLRWALEGETAAADPSVHGLSGLLMRRFSRRAPKRRSWQQRMARISGFLDHHFDARRRARQSEQCIGEDDGLRPADYFVLGVAIETSVTVLAGLLGVLKIHPLGVMWALAAVGALGTFIVFKVISEHVLFSRGVRSHVDRDAAFYAAGTMTTIFVRNSGEIFGAERDLSPEFALLVVLPSLVTNFALVFSVFVCYVRQANLLTFTRSVRRFRFGVNVCAVIAASVYFVPPAVLMLISAGMIDLAGTGGPLVWSLGGVAVYFVFHRVVIEGVIRWRWGPFEMSWRCRECGTLDNETLAGMAADHRDWGADVCTHCPSCGAFALGPIFFPVALDGHDGSELAEQTIGTTHDLGGDVGQALDDERKLLAGAERREPRADPWDRVAAGGLVAAGVILMLVLWRSFSHSVLDESAGERSEPTASQPRESPGTRPEGPIDGSRPLPDERFVKSDDFSFVTATSTVALGLNVEQLRALGGPALRNVVYAWLEDHPRCVPSLYEDVGTIGVALSDRGSSQEIVQSIRVRITGTFHRDDMEECIHALSIGAGLDVEPHAHGLTLEDDAGQETLTVYLADGRIYGGVLVMHSSSVSEPPAISEALRGAGLEQFQPRSLLWFVHAAPPGSTRQDDMLGTLGIEARLRGEDLTIDARVQLSAEESADLRGTVTGMLVALSEATSQPLDPEVLVSRLETSVEGSWGHLHTGVERGWVEALLQQLDRRTRAGQTTASDWPYTSILYQPWLRWSDRSTSADGTGFVTRASDGRLVAVGSARAMLRPGVRPAEVGYVDLASGEMLLSTSRALGRAEGGRDVEGRLASVVLLPVDAAVDQGRVVRLAGAPPKVGEQVWLPLKNDSQGHGYELLAGRITAVERGWIEAAFEERVTLDSDDGTPLVSRRSGRAVGILSRVVEAPDGPMVIRFVPAAVITRALDEPRTLVPLVEALGLRAPK